MTRFFWVDGRLSWPLVALIGFLTIWLLVLDYVWRVVTVQFETLLIFAVVSFVAGLLALALASRRLRRNAPQS
jgi:hypothetical protein